MEILREVLKHLPTFMIMIAVCCIVIMIRLYFFMGWKDRYFLKFRSAHKLYMNSIDR